MNEHTPTPLLDAISFPDDLKKLDRHQLPLLAEEIRGEIIRVVTRNGGHLASSLGAVDLICALHYVFDAPRDKIVFDVGHQAYAHKILTGRRAEFEKIRQEGGLSGFPRRDESLYDDFGAGHASTSISAALGLAAARDLHGRDHRVVAVIGDGALTGGVALEALNHAGDLRKKNFIIVLNDNRMSISPNVGGLSTFFSLRFSTEEYRTMRGWINSFFRQVMPQRGERILRSVKKVEEAVKSFLFEPSAFFTVLGLKYIGPLDGHDLPTLVEALNNLKTYHRPIMLHVITTKGKGYPPAEDDPLSFHGIGGRKKTESGQDGPWDEHGKVPPKPPSRETYTDVFGKFMEERAEADPSLVAITAAMSQGTGLSGFFKKFPARAFDVGIAEQHAITFAAGMAADGFHPVVAMYSTFLQRAFDQLYHDVAMQNLPVLLAVDRAGLVGEDGPTHHGGLDLSYLRLLPNFTVMAPRHAGDLRRMLDFGLSLSGPSAVRYPRGVVSGLADLDDPAPLAVGKGEKLLDGDDLCLLALGAAVAPALTAAERLGREGRRAAVVDLRFLKPLDEELILAEAKKCGRLLTIEDNTLTGGLAGAVGELLARNSDRFPVTIRSLGLPDQLLSQAERGRQLTLAGLDAEAIYQAGRSLLMNKRKRGCGYA